MSEYIFKGKAFICGAYQDSHRCDVEKLQFDVSQKIEVAKLNLLGTNLKTYEPVLLDVIIKVSKEQKGKRRDKEEKAGRRIKTKRREFKG